MLGVAVAFELENLNRVLRSRKVRWHWAQPIFALFVLFSIVSYWWGIAKGGNDEAITLAQFLPVMFALVLLVLLAAVSLPDSVEPDGVDLGAYYQSNRRYQWGLMALFMWSIHLSYVFNVLQRDLPWQQAFLALAPDTLVGMLIVAMMFIRRWWLVGLGLAILCLGPIAWLSRTL